MSDFNKGDFTQQGVDGHVTATLRLNEKRLVNIDLTSNEEAEGCTIAGTVTDLLNDKVYPIGSAPSGNIEITENGENINVAPYATATVNVAGGDYTTAEITIRKTNFDDFGPVFYFTSLIPVIYNGEYAPIEVSAVNDSITVSIPLYQGTAVFNLNDFIADIAITYEDNTVIVDITGDIIFDDENDTLTVSGDCSIGVGFAK